MKNYNEIRKCIPVVYEKIIANMMNISVIGKLGMYYNFIVRRNKNITLRKKFYVLDVN